MTRASLFATAMGAFMAFTTFNITADIGSWSPETIEKLRRCSDCLFTGWIVLSGMAMAHIKR